MGNSLLEPIEWVARNSTYVTIDENALQRFVQDFSPSVIPPIPTSCPFPLMKFKTVEETIDFWFVADMQAFCFWGYPTKWTITYRGQRLDGWWGMLACLQRALEQGMPLLEGRYLAALTEAQARSMFAGEPEIPLFLARIALLRESGRILADTYRGRFHHFLATAPTHALKLVHHIARVFPGFDDVVLYKGKTVAFYKKAQLLVGDLAHTIEGGPTITGFDQLIGEADYKIPALLRSLGILRFAPELAVVVDTRIELPEGSVMEVEIRASMLWAVQLLLTALKPRFPQLNASILDRRLWYMSQDTSLMTHPYHLTRTVNY